MKRFLPLFLLLLAACAAPKTPGPDSGPAAARAELAAPSSRAELLAQLTKLPGAQLEGEEPLRFSYPGERLFASGAVLPLPGGPQLLDPLAELLKRHPQTKWQLALRVQTAHGAGYDQFLAEKRSELLATYLLSKGVELLNLDFQPQAAPGAPLEMTLQPPAAAN